MNETHPAEQMLVANVADIIRCTALSLLAVQTETGHTDTDIAATFTAEALRGLGANPNAYSAPVHAVTSGVTRVFLQAAPFDAVIADTIDSVTLSSVRRASLKMSAAAAETTAVHLIASLDFDAFVS